MITIENLYKAFGNNQVLKGIDLGFDQPGRITAVLGPNGSGKTTLIKCILGMVLPDQGDIRVSGRSIKNQWHYRERIAYLPQIARFPENLRVKDLIAFIKDIRALEAEDRFLIDLLQLEPYLDKRLATLSGGTRQKVNLTLAFMYDSPLLILDEPTSGLDPVAMQHLRRLIKRDKQRGKMILITTHIMSFVEEVADDIVFLLEGKVHFQTSIERLQAEHQQQSVEQAIAQILQAQWHAPAKAALTEN